MKLKIFICNRKYSGPNINLHSYLSLNLGLTIAEIELSSEDEVFEKPTWLGKEVTGIEKYYNSKMSKNPFKDW